MTGGTAWRGVRAVLFDLDGTLIDSAPDLGGAADDLRRAKGLESLPFERYRPHAGAGARGMLQVAFGLTPDDVAYEAERELFYRAYEARLTRLTRAFDGVADLLDRLVVGGLPWGVVTNKAHRFADPLARAMPLFDGASAFVCGDTTPHAKPHPAPLLEAARRLSLQPGECIYVGDDLRDIQAGRAAGMRTVAAAYGYHGAGVPLHDWGADATIHSPTGLLKLLELP